MVEEYTQYDKDVYFAKLKDEDFLAALADQRRWYLTFLHEKGYANRVARSWELYHGFDRGTYWGRTGVQVGGGRNRSKAYIVFNQFKAMTNVLSSFLVQQKPNWDTISNNSDPATHDLTHIGNVLLDSISLDNSKNFGQVQSDCIETGLILGQAAVWNPWMNQYSRPKNRLNPETKKLEYEKDIEFKLKYTWDIAFDYTAGDARESPWMLVRNLENKFDLMDELPKYTERIKELTSRQQSDSLLTFFNKFYGNQLTDDKIWVNYFYHRPTRSLPRGRFVRCISNQVLEDTFDKPEKERKTIRHIPVHVFSPGKIIATCLGRTDLWDLIGPQEALNAAASAMLTNQERFSQIKIWQKFGEPINSATLDPNANAWISETQPKVLPLLDPNTMVALQNCVQLYTATMEQVYSVNPAARGFGGKAQSGDSMKFQADRTRQASAQVQRNIIQWLSNLGTSTLIQYAENLEVREVQVFNEETGQLEDTYDYETRLIRRIGTSNSSAAMAFDKRDLADIEVVNVTLGDPELHTKAGRMNYAFQMRELGADPWECFDVVHNGDISQIGAVDRAQAQKAREEGEMVRRGDSLEGWFYEYEDHVTHIKRHLIDLAKLMHNPEKRVALEAHNMKHFEALQNPSIIQFCQIVGWRIGPPQVPGGPNAGGPPPKGAGPIEGPRDLNMQGQGLPDIPGVGGPII